MIHNHGAEEGEGLACNEFRLPDGSIMGACLLTQYDVMVVAEYWQNVRLLIGQYARLGIYVTEDDFEPSPDWIEKWKKNRERITKPSVAVRSDDDGEEYTQQLTHLTTGDD